METSAKTSMNVNDIFLAIGTSPRPPLPAFSEPSPYHFLHSFLAKRLPKTPSGGMGSKLFGGMKLAAAAASAERGGGGRTQRRGLAAKCCK